MYRDMPMSRRLDRIGELLAKGAYLHMKKEKEAAKAKEEKEKVAPRIETLIPDSAGKDK